MAVRFRLISHPSCLGYASLQFLGGPGARASGRNTAADGGEQTFATIGDTWDVQIPLAQTIGQRARRQRGIVTAVASGDVAVRIDLPDRDRMTREEAGMTGSTAPRDWSDTTWSGGTRWRPGYPLVSVAGALSSGAAEVSLADEHWGHALGLGDMIGFVPHHFGWYVVTGVAAAGTYRIWPRLRRNVFAGGYATLQPVCVFRAVPGAFGWGRDGLLQAGAALRLREVRDADVRTWFTVGAAL